MDNKVKDQAIAWNAEGKCGACGKLLSPRHYILYLEETPVRVCTMCKRLLDKKKEEK